MPRFQARSSAYTIRKRYVRTQVFFLNTEEKITVVHFLPQNLSNQTQPIYTKATHIFAKFVAELTAMCMVGLELLERLCALSILRVSFTKNYG